MATTPGAVTPNPEAPVPPEGDVMLVNRTVTVYFNHPQDDLINIYGGANTIDMLLKGSVPATPRVEQSFSYDVTQEEGSSHFVSLSATRGGVETPRTTPVEVEIPFSNPVTPTILRVEVT